MKDVMRLRYFDNEFLDAADFGVEQEYHRGMRYWHTRHFHTWGLARFGLEVKKAENQKTGEETKVAVYPGTALDNEGREIVLPGSRILDFDQPRFEGGKSYYVTIRWHEEQGLPRQDNQHKRWVENPHIDAIEGMPERPDMELVLAKVLLRKENKTIESIDDSMRRYAAHEVGDKTVTSVKIVEADGKSGQDINRGDGIKTAHIQDDAVIEPKIKNDSISSAKIKKADGTTEQDTSKGYGIKTGHIQDHAVITVKIADKAVTEAKLEANSVTSSKIKDGNVGTAELANGAVTEAKLGTDVKKRLVSIGDAAKAYVDNLLVGCVAAFAMEKVPDGWLECNGQAISRTDYERLFKKIGITFGAGDGEKTFNVPDLRGEFIRGWDGGISGSKGLDPDRTFGSRQQDQIQSHKHIDSGHGHGGQVSTHGNHSHRLANVVKDTGGRYGCPVDCGHCHGLTWPGYQGTPHPYTDGAGDHTHSVTISGSTANLGEPTASSHGNARHGNETRPKNVALMYCIKY